MATYRLRGGKGWWIAAAFIVVPALEIWSIITMGGWIGGVATFLLMVASGIVGGYLMRQEGRKAWTEAQRQMEAGQMPGRALLDGLCIVAGGILLISPGFVTDLIGITLLLPLTRRFYRSVMLAWLEKKMRGGSFMMRGGRGL
ncbi:exlusion protein FxsA [Paenibacillus darwinianus]|uniref:Exlusion protein FxsA n=1 Tax=Paenibacillus darwinianus TaxID=1380763 RepID=A0A9W5S106_9BACL|nr:FxsA family protein [Paenibacillus darwinianus]EXX89389.1 exlusion protein FxsA [Paenibacillus darwinianus]EXX91601.1 exlusion protein FxsA [Paenibacillus darwinianus]EXX92462.1 exlusion protein FxsA [Paenibacillus darwinianus]